MKALVQFVQDNEHLEDLMLNGRDINDTFFEMLSECLIGNTRLNMLGVIFNKSITDKSVPYFLEIAKKSHIKETMLWKTSISADNQQRIEDAFSTPIEEREIPLKSNTKSAAKITSKLT